jgi:hypothetical protein
MAMVVSERGARCRRRDRAFREERPQPLDDAACRVGGDRRPLEAGQLPGRLVEQAEVGEHPADVDPEPVGGTGASACRGAVIARGAAVGRDYDPVPPRRERWPTT